jgi:hypothetical protein
MPSVANSPKDLLKRALANEDRIMAVSSPDLEPVLRATLLEIPPGTTLETLDQAKIGTVSSRALVEVLTAVLPELSMGAAARILQELDKVLDRDTEIRRATLIKEFGIEVLGESQVKVRSKWF